MEKRERIGGVVCVNVTKRKASKPLIKFNL